MFKLQSTTCRSYNVAIVIEFSKSHIINWLTETPRNIMLQLKIKITEYVQILLRQIVWIKNESIVIAMMTKLF